MSDQTLRETFKAKSGTATIYWWHVELLCEILGIDPDEPLPVTHETTRADGWPDKVIWTR